MRVQRGKIARELAQLEEQMDRALERAFATTSARLAGAADAWRPALDVLETESGIVLRIDLAGVSSDEVRVVVDGEYVQISGRRTLSRAGQNQRHLLIELPQGPFERVLRMRTPYDADAVRARLEDGILIVELPRAEGRTRSIQVRS